MLFSGLRRERRPLGCWGGVVGEDAGVGVSGGT